MKVSVYDTYVPKTKDKIMHFDILVEATTPTSKVYQFGNEYLSQKNIPNGNLTTNECEFCHMETAPEHVEEAINTKGYFIIEMENCN